MPYIHVCLIMPFRVIMITVLAIECFLRIFGLFDFLIFSFVMLYLGMHVCLYPFSMLDNKLTTNENKI